VPSLAGKYRSVLGHSTPAIRGSLIDVADVEVTESSAERTWLTVPDLVEMLHVSVGRVHRLIEDRHLLATRRDGVLSIPADFIVDGEPMTELRGTLFVLADAGFTDDEAMDWLLQPEDALGAAPIDALRSGRKAEVRRIAQALG
jgi:hypothetical protein